MGILKRGNIKKGGRALATVLLRASNIGDLFSKIFTISPAAYFIPLDNELPS